MAEAITQACSQCESPLLPGDTIGVWGQAVLDFNKKGRTIIRPLDSAEVLCEDCFEETNQNLNSILDLVDEALNLREAKRGESEEVVEDPMDALRCCSPGKSCCGECVPTECESEYLDWGMTRSEFIEAAKKATCFAHAEEAREGEGCRAVACIHADAILRAAGE